MSAKCTGCGTRTAASAGYCRSCKSTRHHAFERIKSEGLVVDEAGGAWWIWNKKGDVLVMGEPTKSAAINALAFGSDDDADDSKVGKKSRAQLEAEIAEALAR